MASLNHRDNFASELRQLAKESRKSLDEYGDLEEQDELIDFAGGGSIADY